MYKKSGNERKEKTTKQIKRYSTIKEQETKAATLTFNLTLAMVLMECRAV
jgi:hypothetical protein